MKFSYSLLFCLLTTLINAQPLPKTWNDSGEIPFELVKNKIILNVSIKGKSYRFLLDTGGVFMISERLQKQYRFQEVDKTIISDINKKETALVSVIVPQISIGNWEFSNRKAIVDPDSEEYPSQCFELDGMIGRDFFDKVLLHFDYARKLLRITENEQNLVLNAEKRTKLKLSHRGIPEILLRINGKKKCIEFDSGSGDFFSYQSKQAKKIRKKNTKDKLVFSGIFSFGIDKDHIKSSDRYRIKVDNFEMAGTHFPPFYSNFSKISAPRIGADILNYGATTLDFKNGWFYFEPFPEKHLPSTLETFGFDIARIEGVYIVKWILKGTEAEQAGVSYGDRVVRINDKDIEEVAQGCEGYLNGYSYKEVDKIKIELVGRNGEPKLIHLKKQLF